MRSKVTVLINRSSGSLSDDGSRQRLTSLIAEALVGAEVVVTSAGEDIARLAKEAIDGGSSMVVAVGGDGTINAVASVVAGTDTVLGILPLGTLNHFAKDLGIPLSIEAALQVLRAGRVARVDIGQVNERTFLNNAGLGLYPNAVFLREAEQSRGIAKWPAAALAAIVELSRYRLLTVDVSVDGRRLLRTTPMVFIGNNNYELAGVGIPSRSRLDAGRLCLCIPHPTSRLRLLLLIIRAVIGRLHPGDDFDSLLTEALSIRSRNRHLRISIDGESDRLATPLDFRIRPGALRVAVPSPSI